MKKIALFTFAAFAVATVAVAGPFRLRLFRCGPSGCDAQPMYLAQEADQSEPIEQPKQPTDKAVDVSVENHGVEFSKIKDGCCLLNGRPVTMEQAIGVVSGQIPDDSKKFRLTVIGADGQRKPVVDAFSQVEREVKERIVIWDVPPDHWSLKDNATGKTVFKVDGAPTVYLQAPDGKVLHRQDDWSGVDDFQAIRKAMKAYDSSKDPDFRKPNPEPKKPAGPEQSTNNLPWILAAILGAMVLLRRRE